MSPGRSYRSAPVGSVASGSRICSRAGPSLASFFRPTTTNGSHPTGSRSSRRELETTYLVADVRDSHSFRSVRAAL